MNGDLHSQIIFKLEQGGTMKTEDLEDVSELEAAIAIVKKSGYQIVHPLSFAGNSYIQELAVLVENAGYKLEEIKSIRNEDGKWLGSISLSVFPMKTLEDLERKGEF